jgi:hypothetical protein
MERALAEFGVTLPATKIWFLGVMSRLTTSLLGHEEVERGAGTSDD